MRRAPFGMPGSKNRPALCGMKKARFLSADRWATGATDSDRLTRVIHDGSSRCTRCFGPLHSEEQWAPRATGTRKSRGETGKRSHEGLRRT